MHTERAPRTPAGHSGERLRAGARVLRALVVALNDVRERLRVRLVNLVQRGVREAQQLQRLRQAREWAKATRRCEEELNNVRACRSQPSTRSGVPTRLRGITAIGEIDYEDCMQMLARTSEHWSGARGAVHQAWATSLTAPQQYISSTHTDTPQTNKRT